jgi:hypothetical protein
VTLKLTYKNMSWKIPDDGCCVTGSWHYDIVHRAHCKASHCICVAIQALLDAQLFAGTFPHSHHLKQKCLCCHILFRTFHVCVEGWSCLRKTVLTITYGPNKQCLTKKSENNIIKDFTVCIFT